MKSKISLAACCVASLAFAQSPPKPFQAQSSSTISLRPEKDWQNLEITNVSYEVIQIYTPDEKRLLLRKTTNTKEILGEKGMEASTTLETWPLGADLKQKPLYTIKAEGTDGRTVDGSLFVLSRGLEDTDWWSAYSLKTGAHLFDTFTLVAGFSISREEVKMRYIGFDIPADDTKDARLKDPHVVGVITYASADRVLREALVTCDDTARATVLRSFADATPTLSLGETTPVRSFRISISQNYPSAPATVTISIPILRDDLDLARATLPPKLHIAAWKR